MTAIDTEDEQVTDPEGRILGWVLADGQVLAGRSRSTATRVGSITADGACSSGSSRYQQERAGRFDERGVVWSGPQWKEVRVGRVDADGRVYREGPGTRESLLATHASTRGGAALLLLLSPAEPPETTATGTGLFSAIAEVATRTVQSTLGPAGVWWETEEGVAANLRRQGVERAPRNDVPAEIQEKLRALKGLGDPTDIDDEDTGLAFQYLVGIVDGPELDELIKQRTRLNDLVKRGLWKP